MLLLQVRSTNEQVTLNEIYPLFFTPLSPTITCMNKKLPTEPYKGVRDFYPDDMAVQRYIFDVWSQTAESFGYARYDASVLEPAELYSAKTSEEMVSEQTYTFTDRGDRQVTLRPEMTPTVARMIAAKRRELAFPVRWYSIPNLFRYERTQRGRLREHWQLNCDIFGTDDRSADVEIIALAYQMFLNFGAEPDMFEIRVNDRAWLNRVFDEQGFDAAQRTAMFALLDRKEKIDNFDEEATAIAGGTFTLPTEPDPESDVAKVIAGLRELGIENVIYSASTVRGLTYYTGVVFEIFDTDPTNRRAMLGGGRYDNLTELFGGDPVPGIGFGMGDVTMRDFLETHGLLTADLTAPTIMVLPTDPAHNIVGQKIAQEIRATGISTSVDISTKKLGKKISAASDSFVDYVLIVGDDEIASNTYTLKNLNEGTEKRGTLDKLLTALA